MDIKYTMEQQVINDVLAALLQKPDNAMFSKSGSR